MPGVQKKVFLSYRRKVGAYLARLVYQHLKRQEYDVFMDVESVDSGEFPTVILNQIEARPHFLIVLMPGSLQRTVQEGDWLRREIEHALHSERNIVPMLAEDFSFEDEEERLKRLDKSLPPKVKELSKHNGFSVPSEYFDAAMEKLTARFLKKEVKVAVKPTPIEEQPIVQRMIINASLAKPAPVGGWSWSSRKQLDAPTLSALPSNSGWEWTPVFLATGYVLETSRDEAFKKAIKLYDGTETTYMASPSLKGGLIQKLPTYKPRAIAPSLGWLDEVGLGDFRLGGNDYYRVKAKGGFAFLDSPWSNVVEVAPPRKTTLEAPVLLQSATGEWTWTRAVGATGYILQESYSATFENPTALYDGDQTTFTSAIISLLGRTAHGLTKYYRVKAKGGFAFSDSPWSNVVKVEASRKTALEAPVLEQKGSGLNSGWKWTPVIGAKGYVLQMSEDSSFDKTEELYDGTSNEWPVPSLLSASLPTHQFEYPLLKPRVKDFGKAVNPLSYWRTKYYRVKAKGGAVFLDSPWSNVVELPFG